MEQGSRFETNITRKAVISATQLMYIGIIFRETPNNYSSFIKTAHIAIFPDSPRVVTQEKPPVTQKAAHCSTLFLGRLAS